MQKTQSRRYRAYRRAQRFVSDLKIGAGTQLASLVALFLAAMAVVEQHIQEQDTADSEAHRLTAELKEQLELLIADWMRPVAHAAQALYGRGSAAMRGFALPKKDDRIEEVLATAGTLADAAAPIQAQLAEHGLEPDFVAKLRSAAEAVRETADLRDRAVERRTGATAGLRTAMDQARALVILLNTLLTRELRKDSTRLEEWRTAIRINDAPGPRRSKSGSDAPETEAAAAAPAVAPAPVIAPVVAPMVSAAPEPVAPSTGEAKA